MREMKDSGIEWVGMIPNDWDTTRIKYLYEIKSGATPSPNEENWDGDVVWITPADYKTKDKYIQCGKRNLSDIGYQSCSTTTVPIGSIVFSKRAPIGTVALAATELCTNQGCLSCIPKKNNNWNVYFYYVMSIGTEHFELLGRGTTFKEISANSFGDCKLPLPALSEQQSIAAYLDRKCAEIDTLTADIETQIETLEQYKRSVITEAVTKGLNPDAEMKDSGVRWIGQMPAHWKAVKIKYLVQIRKENGMFDPENDHYIGLENVQGYSNDLIETNTQYEPSIQNVCYAGDIMFGKLRPYLAKVIIAPFDGYCTGEFLQFSNFKGYKKYLYYSLLNELFIDYVNASTYGAKMPRANTDFIINSYISYPSVEEQHKIAAYLDQKCSEIDSIITDKRTQRDILAEYKKSLIYEYVTGKKEVPVS